MKFLIISILIYCTILLLMLAPETSSTDDQTPTEFSTEYSEGWDCQQIQSVCGPFYPHQPLDTEGIAK